MKKSVKTNFFLRKPITQLSTRANVVGIRYWWLIIISAIIHRLPFAVFPEETFVDIKTVSMVVSYIVLLWALCWNLELRSIRVMTLGTILNFAAIVTNGGLMPVSPEARQLAHMVPLDVSRSGMVLPEGSGILLPLNQTNLWLLTDIIPAGYLGGVYSIGDIFITAGLLIFVLEIANRVKINSQHSLTYQSEICKKKY